MVVVLGVGFLKLECYLLFGYRMVLNRCLESYSFGYKGLCYWDRKVYVCDCLNYVVDFKVGGFL